MAGAWGKPHMSPGSLSEKRRLEADQEQQPQEVTWRWRVASLREPGVHVARPGRPDPGAASGVLRVAWSPGDPRPARGVISEPSAEHYLRRVGDARAQGWFCGLNRVEEGRDP